MKEKRSRTEKVIGVIVIVIACLALFWRCAPKVQKRLSVLHTSLTERVVRGERILELRAGDPEDTVLLDLAENRIAGLVRVGFTVDSRGRGLARVGVKNLTDCELSADVRVGSLREERRFEHLLITVARGGQGIYSFPFTLPRGSARGTLDANVTGFLYDCR